MQQFTSANLIVSRRTSGQTYCSATTRRSTRTAILLLIITVGWFLGFGVRAGPQQPVPTNSLAFHLQSLGGTPTRPEHEVIERALTLMKRYGCRSDLPLREIKRDDNKKEWILFFDGGKPDFGFNLYIRDKNADWFEVDYPMVQGRHRFPPEQKNR